MQSDVTKYVGSELDIFRAAHRWKSYVAALLQPWVRGVVLDVGAGLGANLAYLAGPAVDRWVALEPDPSLAAQIPTDDPRVDVLCGTLADVPASRRFDSIIYIDVLEHIADDRAELLAASRHLAAGGRMIILSPAHPVLYSPFDAAIGHHRRYTKRGIASLGPPGCRLEQLRMVDSVGLFASLANRLLLRQSMPTARQIALWDGAMVPISRRIDHLFGYRAGKTVIAVWQRTANG
jgi:SAM-dependent methyltransferase